MHILPAVGGLFSLREAKPVLFSLKKRPEIIDMRRVNV